MNFKVIARNIGKALLVNAFFMLRTGFLARNYILEECNDEDSKLETRRSAFIDASIALPELAINTIIAPVTNVVMDGVVNPTKKAVKGLFSMWGIRHERPRNNHSRPEGSRSSAMPAQRLGRKRRSESSAGCHGDDGRNERTARTFSMDEY